MTRAEIIRWRMANQHLVRSRVRAPEKLVAAMGAMQAQEYAMVKWAIALRVPNTTAAAIEDAVNTGRILRTHILRPTWHLVAPADLRWMLALTAPRVRAAMAYMDRQLEVDRALQKRVNRALAKALEGGRQLSRAAVQTILVRNKINVSGPRLAHVLIHAELDGLICSGARTAGRFTYALLDERVPPTKSKDRDEALVELARRYFSTRGPAAAPDFAWWSGLTISDAKNAMAQVEEGYGREVIDGLTYLFPEPAIDLPEKPGGAFLLPDYDELVIGYKDRAALFANAANAQAARFRVAEYNRSLLFDGCVVGSWRREESNKAAAIEIVSFSTLSQKARRAVIAAAELFGEFLDKTVEVTFRVQSAK